MKRNHRGFTLIELLVIIAIIGLLAAIIFGFLTGARSKARDAKGQSDLKQIKNAFELKYSDNGYYPDLPDVLTEIPDGDTRLDPYLNPTPRTNGIRIYRWKDGGDNQKFCVLFAYESRPGYFTCSHKGCSDNMSEDCPDF